MEVNLKLHEGHKVRVLVAEDSPTVRLMLCRMLEMDPDIKVVGTAANGREAVEQVAALKPDLVTMDVNMPVMDGLAAIENIMAANPVPVLVVSSVVDRENAANAARALGAGAVDVIVKPTPKSLDEFNRVAAGLTARIKLLSRARVITYPRARLAHSATHSDRAVPASGAHPGRKVVAIGSSTGGPQALHCILRGLPADLKMAVVVVQHIARGFTDGLIEWLSGNCKLKIIKGYEGHSVNEGEIVIAPGSIHMVISPGGHIRLVQRPVPGPHKPSIDVLMESVADVYGRNAIGVILTGMGRDGAQGIKAIHDRGGYTIAQDQNTSVIFSMAKEAIKLGGVDKVVPLSEVGNMILKKS